VNDSYGHHLETYTERVKGAVIDEPFMYTDCFDDSVDFSPPSSYVTKVQLELVCICAAAAAGAATTTTVASVKPACFSTVGPV